MYVNGIDEEETYTSIHLLGGHCLFVRDDIIIAALAPRSRGARVRMILAGVGYGLIFMHKVNRNLVQQ